MKKTLLGLCLAAAATLSAAAGYPEKTVTIVVPFPPGGSTDAIARVVAQKAQEKLGQSFIIDNRAGATGTIGAAFVKRAPADGYTLLVSSLGPFVIAPHLYKGVQYDALKDFEPITILVQAPNVLVVPNNSPDHTVAELLADLKKNPGKVSFASSGVGSSDHLSAELLWQQTGTQGLHVPYKGGGPAISDLLGGQVNAAFVNINSIIGHIKAGKVRALGISSDKRSPLLPDVPTLQEQGVKGAEVQSWQAMVAPKGTPHDVIVKLHDVAVAAMNDPAIKPKLLEQGFEIVGDTPEQFAKYQASEYARWKKLIETRKITAE
ncbi:tripartite tricarboxylate transporter substrate binding protein [Ramlibacter sp. G-1-2-2]|uniref:Tripartite tricarboxylate transporter substrate binding protein n=1 Tax=Ramlibacter agri TaxID=2728837 RepID=A0A848H1R7_9BURK|nr:tripartite tricarboxylate transporter substrate binding protein [Ramlibacter agri]NML43602.1 tripartite tricarboxylate transporter substrate binding protein [Ramlibacter agri]